MVSRRYDAWVFAPMHYWNSVTWSVSCQAGFYFLFPFIARRVHRILDAEESHIAAQASSPGQPVPSGAMQELDAQVRWTRRLHQCTVSDLQKTV